jgi:hypothetical protein
MQIYSRAVAIRGIESSTPVAVVGNSAVVSGNFTRPADTTAYASGDLVANNTTAGSVTPITLAVSRVANSTVLIRKVRLKKSTTSTTNASFRIHFYSASPTCTNGDNGAWLTTESTYIGACDVTVDKVFSDASKGNGVPMTGTEMIAVPASATQNIFALIEARAAYTPGNAEVFTLSVECLRD